MINPALQQIENAGMSATAYRLARRLLDRAELTGGATTLDRATLIDLADVSTWAAARKILAKTQPAGVSWQPTAADGITVIFEALYHPESPRHFGATRAEMARENAPARQNGADRAKMARADDLETSEAGAVEEAGAALLPERNDPAEDDPRHFGADSSHSLLVSKLVNTPLLDDSDTNLLTNSNDPRQNGARFEFHPEHQPQNQNEIITTAQLLRDPAVNIDIATARQIAKTRSIEITRRAVARYLDGKEAGEFRSPGIIITWLQDPDAYALPHDYEPRELFSRYRTGREISLERAAEAEAAAWAEQAEQEAAQALQEAPAPAIEPEQDQSPRIPAHVEDGSPEAVWYTLLTQAEDAANVGGRRGTLDSFGQLYPLLSQATLEKATPGALTLTFSDPSAGHFMQRSRRLIAAEASRIAGSEYQIHIHAQAPA